MRSWVVVASLALAGCASGASRPVPVGPLPGLGAWSGSSVPLEQALADTFFAYHLRSIYVDARVPARVEVPLEPAGYLRDAGCEVRRHASGELIVVPLGATHLLLGGPRQLFTLLHGPDEQARFERLAAGSPAWRALLVGTIVGFEPGAVLVEAEGLGLRVAVRLARDGDLLDFRFACAGDLVALRCRWSDGGLVFEGFE